MNFEELPIAVDLSAPESCMGGGCTSKQQCALFNADDRSNPKERLCGLVERPAPVEERAA